MKSIEYRIQRLSKLKSELEQRIAQLRAGAVRKPNLQHKIDTLTADAEAIGAKLAALKGHLHSLESNK